MQLGMVGLGRMGANMTRRVVQAGHTCVVFDANQQAMAELAREGAQAAATLKALVDALTPPRAVWLMLPAAVVGQVINSLRDMLAPGDIIIDGGNSDHRAAAPRAKSLRDAGVGFVDVGTSGGVWGLERGYCLMIGGEAAAVAMLVPIFNALTTTPSAWLHCGPHGAGHFVKMVHNGIEYALMAAYAEGFNLLAHTRSAGQQRSADAETAPLADQDAYRFDFDLPAIAELWRHGSVVRSWLLDLTAAALHEDPALEGFSGRVSDSGEGRWALQAAIELTAPAPLLAAALFGRYSSRDEDAYANKLLSAMRAQFGGHAVKSRA